MLEKLEELGTNELWFKMRFIMSDTEYSQIKANRMLTNHVKQLTGHEPTIIKCIMHTIGTDANVF